MVKCGVCGIHLRQRTDLLPGTRMPVLFSRTLVSGAMVPSCSETCARQLRLAGREAAAREWELEHRIGQE